MIGGEDEEIVVERWVEIEDQLRQVKVNVVTDLEVLKDRVGAVKGDVAHLQLQRNQFLTSDKCNYFDCWKYFL